MITKLTLPQKILFFTKKKGHVSISPRIDLFVFTLVFTRNLPFWHNSYKINPPSQKSFFYQKRKDMCQFLPQMDVSLIGKKRKDACTFCQKSHSRHGYQIRFCHWIVQVEETEQDIELQAKAVNEYQWTFFSIIISFLFIFIIILNPIQITNHLVFFSFILIQIFH